MGLDCDPNAVCDPFRGCLCKPGYQGDGTNCEGKQTNFLVLVEGVVFGSQKLGLLCCECCRAENTPKTSKKIEDSVIWPFKPWCKTAYSPYCSPYISYGQERFVEISSHLIPGDHFLYSHHFNVWTSIDNVERNFIFVTVRAWRVYGVSQADEKDHKDLAMFAGRDGWACRSHW